MNYETLHLDPNEHVIMEVRKHWIIFAGHALALLFAAFLPFIVFVLFKLFVLSKIPLLPIPPALNMYNLSLFFYTLWLLFLWLSFFVNWTKYYLDVWYVTEKRIIAIEQKRIFDREISNLRFDKIQDITIDIHGFIPTFLDFGDIKVQTASEDNLEFTMSVVRHPDQVRRVIFSQHNEIGDIALKRTPSEANQV